MKIKDVFVSILKGILAGLSIAFGGFLFIVSTTYIKGDIGKALGATLFPIGLFIVCTFSLFLFTGKIGLIFEEKQSKEFYISIPLMLIGNAIGAISLGYILFFIFKDTDIMDRAIEVSNLRLKFDSFSDYLACFIKSSLCGLCVYLAVKAFNQNRLKPVGIFLLFFFIFLFVYAGFEHSIANMYYFSMSNSWSIYAIIDLVLCILGNILGTIPGVLLLKLFNKNNK